MQFSHATVYKMMAFRETVKYTKGFFVRGAVIQFSFYYFIDEYATSLTDPSDCFWNKAPAIPILDSSVYILYGFDVSGCSSTGALTIECFNFLKLLLEHLSK
ncbi:hypothetical protein AYI69_g457 [Smittium culicis]|uniref:Uncharacterized protein n=1 Tax=Smittium culicis TaxID=133412 RepID=A0A1R1YSY9_9FUNG|nr:hypothetical protein AYI69_g457 [Smittium culicis]